MDSFLDGVHDTILAEGYSGRLHGGVFQRKVFPYVMDASFRQNYLILNISK